MTVADRHRPVSVVTGGGGGIGSACARRLARRGGVVVIVEPGVSVEGHHEGERTGARTADAIRAEGGTAVHSEISVTDRASIEALFERVTDEYGPVDTVLNTAGIVRFPPLQQTEPDDWSAVLDVHLNGYLNVLGAALPGMVRAGAGRVVGFTSGVGLARTSAGAIAYGVAKRAVAALTWDLGRRLPPGVRVNALSPIAATRMVRGSLIAAGASPAGLDLTAMPQADDMAPAAEWLASNRTDGISGRVIFSAGSELSLIEPPRLLEAVRTEHVADFQTVLDAVVPVVLAPSELAQRTGGGSNPRLHDVFGAPPDRTGRRAPSTWLIVAADPALAEPVIGALGAWSAEGVHVEPPRDGRDPRAGAAEAFGAAEAAVTQATRHPVAGVIVIVGPDTPDGADDNSWAGCLRSHASVGPCLMAHAAWLRAAARLSAGHDRPVRCIHVVPATTPAGRTAAQAVAQMCRSASEGVASGPAATAISLETAAAADLGAFGHLVARLACSQDALDLRGAELVAAPGWIGLRSHPAPGSTFTFGGPEIPSAAEQVMREALAGTDPSVP